MKINQCLDCSHCEVCGFKQQTKDFFSDFYEWIRKNNGKYDMPKFPSNCSIEPKCTNFQNRNFYA